MKGLSEYLAKIAAVNRLDIEAPCGWIFHHGMLFQSTAKWWGAPGNRHAPHEGLDIQMYRTGRGDIAAVSPDFLVPALDDGHVVNICNDFLGRSLVVVNRAFSKRSLSVLAVYAHLDVMPGIETGTSLTKGDIVGTPASTAGKKSKIAAHLHLSILEVPYSFPAWQLDWNLFGNPDSSVHLINPVFL
ncbi:MAG: hypothetical protein R6V41_02265 [Desulfobacteraceae bacterium]